MFAANALIELARIVAKRFKSDLVHNSSTTRLRQFATSISDAQLKELSMSTKFSRFSRDLEKKGCKLFNYKHSALSSVAQVLQNLTRLVFLPLSEFHALIYLVVSWSHDTEP